MIDREKIINDFIELIPMLRARLGITQEELADRIGATRQTIINVEKRKRPLVWSVFLSMALLFFLDPKTRPFLLASKVAGPELSTILFGNTSTLPQAAVTLESDNSMLSKAQGMMEAVIKKQSPEGEQEERL